MEEERREGRGDFMNDTDKTADRGVRLALCLLCFLFLCAACTVQTEDIVACYGMREVLSLGGQPADTCFPRDAAGAFDTAPYLTRFGHAKVRMLQGVATQPEALAGRAILVVYRPGAAAARVVFLLAEGYDTTKEPEEQGFFETKDGFDTFPVVGVYEEAEAGE